MNAVNVADRYFACMRGRDLEGLVGLFSNDATFVLPDGREIPGIAAIRQTYANLFAAAAPSPQPVAMVVGTQAIAVEIETRLADGSVRRTANFFHLDAGGLIKRLSVYARG